MNPPAAAPAPVAAPVPPVAVPVFPFRSSTFFWPLRFLPPARREAMQALYGFCRLVDDLVDEPQSGLPPGTPPPDPVPVLAAWRDWLHHPPPRPPGPATLWTPPELPQRLESAIVRFHLPVGELVAILDGVAMDLPPALCGPDFACLRRYCRGVAGAVGHLTVCILDRADPETRRLAVVLGEALQFTNILRDLEEDACRGRLYLPAEALATAGIALPRPLAAVLADPALPQACAVLAAAAEAAYGEAAALFARWPRRRLWPARAMLILYRRLLHRQRQAGWRRPVFLSGREKAGVAARCWCGWPPVD